MRRRRGFSLVEALVSSSISIGAIAVCTMIYFSGMGSWAKGRGDMESMSSSQIAIKKISKDLQEAMSVTVSNDGMKVDFVLPTKDGSGNYVSPAVPDGVARSYWVDSGKLILISGASQRTIATNVILKNPLTNQTFVPFQDDGNVITRMVEITLGTEKYGQVLKKQSSCVSETVYLRNIPKKKT